MDSSEVPSARKDNQPRAPDRAEHSRFPILLLLSNKYFGTPYCFDPLITPLHSIEKAIEQSATTADGPAVYYNYDEATVGLFFIYFKEISVESPIA